MFRGLVSLVASVSVVAAALAAPMTHVHEDGDDHHAGAHHRGRLVHSHGGTHHTHAAPPVADPAFDAHADRDGTQVRALNVFQLAAGPASAVDAFVPAVFTLAPPQVSPGAAPRVVPRSHDPPSPRSLPSRAPPAHLS